MRSYRPEELFDDDGAPRPELDRAGAARASGGWARTRTPTAACCCRTCGCRTSATTPCPSTRPAASRSEPTRVLGQLLRDVMTATTRDDVPASSGPTRRRPTGWRRVRGDRPHLDGRDRAGRRPPVARRARDGGPQRAPVPGLARGLPADRPPRAVQLLRGVHPHRRLDVQPAREVAEGHARHPLAAADRVAELPAVVARVAPGPQRLLPPGPGLHRPRGQQEGRRSSASTCRRTPTACSRWPTTACAAATTSTSSSPASSRRSTS